MIVAIITEQKAADLSGTEYAPGVQYNPVQLPDDRNFISLVEAQYLTVGDIVELVDYTPDNGTEF